MAEPHSRRPTFNGVTLTCYNPMKNVTLTVTQELEYENGGLWILPGGGWFMPTWITVQITEVLGENHARGRVARREGWTSKEDLDVRPATCACGTIYLLPFGASYPRFPRCHACDNARQAERQRRYRARRRRRSATQRHTVCAHCGTKMTPQRTTRRYCGASCRVAALRTRRKRVAAAFAARPAVMPAHLH